MVGAFHVLCARAEQQACKYLSSLAGATVWMQYSANVVGASTPSTAATALLRSTSASVLVSNVLSAPSLYRLRCTHKNMSVPQQAKLMLRERTMPLNVDLHLAHFKQCGGTAVVACAWLLTCNPRLRRHLPGKIRKKRAANPRRKGEHHFLFRPRQ